MKNANHKGGAAVVAVLIVIMLVAVGSAAMIVTGRNSIETNKELTAPPPKGYDDSSQSEQQSESSLEDSSSLPAVVEETVEKVNYIPQISQNYETISTKDLTCTSAILVDAQTNEIIAGYKYDKKIYPASLTKLLTLLVAVENIDNLDEEYTFTDEDIDPLIEDNASRAGFEAGETVTAEDLLYASILASGADGTLGLANIIAGSEEEFVKLMDQKAAELELTGTKFINSSGLHSKNHYSTVQDIAAITKACLDNELCKKILCTDSYTTSKTKQHEDGITINSIVASRLQGYWVDCDGDGEEDAEILGGKSGFTDEALFTLATICEKDGKEYICVTAKSEGELISVEDTIAIYENYLPDDSQENDENNSDDSQPDESADSQSEQ